jgi:aryl hydrocarbon receptor nuclear translocator
VSSKRSFICRLRIGSTNPLDHTHQPPFINPCILRRRHRTPLGPSNDGHLYEVVHISGYIRNLTTHHHPSSHHDNPSSSSNSNGQMAFIAIARIQNSCTPNVNDLTNGSISSLNSLATEFTCRCHSETGEILFIDQRCTPIIGYKSQELLHKIIVDQIHPDDQMKFQDLYKRTVTQKNLPNTSANLTNIIIRFRTNIDNEYVSLKTSTYAFSNPCTDEIEFIIVTFLSNQTTNKTSVIANSNDYNRQTYETYPRNSSAIVTNPISRYPTQSPSTYTNQEGQDYPTGNGNNDGRTYASNNGGSTWAAANDNWTTANTTTPTTNTDYVDPTLYHQYHQ